MANGLREIRIGGVLLLALDRPERRNSIDLAVTQVMSGALARAERDSTVKAIILKGHTHGFGAGSDLKALAGQSVDEMIADEREMAALARSFVRHPKPIIAAVDGYAIGGGAVYAASCDVVFTSAEAKWALPEVPIGWNCAYGIAAVQARLGPSRARHIFWGADAFDGETAFRLGLADFLAENSAVEAALEYAKKLAALPGHAVAATKELCAAVAGRNATELDDCAMRAFATCMENEKAKETLRKFGMV
jgi:enoyl-CoA hydratase/carnithine racemase